MDPRPRIWAFGVSRLRETYRDIATEYDTAADLRIISRGFEDAVQEIENAGADGPDIVVSAGSNGYYLKARIPIPVVLVTPTGFDVMHALVRARHDGEAIGLVMHGETPYEMARFFKDFGANVVCRSYLSAEDAELCVLELRNSGVNVVVGPGLVTELAEKAGLKSVFLYSRTSVQLAFDMALELARATRGEAARRRRLAQVLEHLRDGVIALDAGGRIEALSAKMAEILNANPSQVVGKRLQDCAGDVAGVVPRKPGEAFGTIGGVSYLVHRNAWGDADSASGSVITFQESQSLQRLGRSVRSRQRASHLAAKYHVEHLIGESSAMQRVREQVRRYARSGATVLILGESGTGKELAAQSLHNGSSRHASPFVVVNCGAFPETLLESELFGYEEGAFTGARRGGKAGLIETGHGGTLFLDEIGEMPLSLQSRLLRVLQEREVVRLGSTEPMSVDVRVIAATHRPLADAVTAGKFRADLFYRLNILNLTLPPLRERGIDIEALGAHLLHEAGAVVSLDAARIALRPVQSLLAVYHWPGNVRELQNVMARIAVALEETDATGKRKRSITAEQLRELAPELNVLPASLTTLRQLSQKSAADVARETLDAFNGDRERTAQALGISKTTLWRKLKSR